MADAECLLVRRVVDLPRRRLGPFPDVQVTILVSERLHLGVETQSLELRRPRRALLCLAVVLLARKVDDEVAERDPHFPVLAAGLLSQELEDVRLGHDELPMARDAGRHVDQDVDDGHDDPGLRMEDPRRLPAGRRSASRKGMQRLRAQLGFHDFKQPLLAELAE